MKYKPLGAAVILRNNILTYDIGGILVPFIFVKLIIQSVRQTLSWTLEGRRLFARDHSHRAVGI